MVTLTFKFFFNGKPINEMTGAISPTVLKKQLRIQFKMVLYVWLKQLGLNQWIQGILKSNFFGNIQSN